MNHNRTHKDYYDNVNLLNTLNKLMSNSDLLVDNRSKTNENKILLFLKAPGLKYQRGNIIYREEVRGLETRREFKVNRLRVTPRETLS